MEKRKVALVTGAGRRLGRQIAYALAQVGYDIIINYNKSKKGAEEAIWNIRNLGREAIAIKADVSSKREVDRMVKTSIKHFRTIDLLVNNAGIFRHSPLLKTTEQIWERTFDINLKGYFLCAQAVSRVMQQVKRGSIINIASLGGIKGWENYLPYSVSKAGVIMLTKCMAKALAPEITVNAIAPGTILIPSEEDPQQKHVPASKIPLQKYGRPEDVTNTVVFLATTSDYITGQVFAVDGGRSM